MTQLSLLIDGNNLTRRYFAAIEHAVGSDTPAKCATVKTRTLSGVSGALNTLTAKFAPTNKVVVFDVGGDTSKLEELSTYKEGRAKTPPLFVEVFPELCVNFIGAGFKDKSEAGVEADNILGKEALILSEHGLVVIVSTDKDFLSLVSANISVYDAFLKKIYATDADVFAKLGVNPNQVADYLALKGDSVDGISGLPGIGEKTAQRLLATHGTLEGIIAAAEKGLVKGAVGTIILENIELARKFKKLTDLHGTWTPSVALSQPTQSQGNPPSATAPNPLPLPLPASPATTSTAQGTQMSMFPDPLERTFGR